jgi:integrative and conjugative element protein (TIGR02256 family)
MSQLSDDQQLALVQLHEIEDASGGALKVTWANELPDSDGWTPVGLSLDFPPAEVPDKGVPLQRVEHVTIHIPPDFPFRYPAVEVSHSRFAELPHVQWRHWICLYRSTADWDVSDGIMGLVTRLSTWYRRAAAGTLDMPGQPVHPPVAYSSARAGCLVIHANAPELHSGRPWRGAAVLRAAGEHRVDLIGWISEENELYRDTESLYAWLAENDRGQNAPISLGAAVMLPEPMSFEFPSRAHALVDAIADRGVTATDLVALFGDVAWINEVRAQQVDSEAGRERASAPPMYIFVGAPMRGIAGSGENLTHLAAWRLGDYEAQLASELVQTWARNADRPEQAELVNDLNSWIDSAAVSWARVYEARPELVQRRDEERPAQWLRGHAGHPARRVMIVGCGALGAPIAEQCVRGGAAEVILVDSGDVNPGILVRQPYEYSEIGQLKAKALARRLGYIGADTHITGITDNALRVFDTDKPPDVDLIIDATANKAVAAKLERCRWAGKKDWPPVLTVAIGHRAERGIATLALRGASGAGADLLRKLALHARSEPHLADVADDFFPDPPRTGTFQPELGCSEPTFRGSATEVQGLAAQLLSGALADLQASDIAEQADVVPGEAKEPPASMSARIARLPYPSGPPTRNYMPWAEDHTQLDAESGYEVRFAPSALNNMQDEAYGTSKTLGTDVETGGILLGLVDDPSRVIWVTSATGPAPGSQQSHSYVRIAAEGVRELITAVEDQSSGQIRFLGMWHTHPHGQPSQSPTDEQAMQELLTNTSHPLLRTLLVIVGGEGEKWDAWLEGDGIPAIYTRFARRPPHLQKPGAADET